MSRTTTRQFGAAIALVSGGYSLLSAGAGAGMIQSTSSAFMALLGIIVVIHGGILLTSYADHLGSASGPLMIGYSVLMLLNQAVVGLTGNMNWGIGGVMAGGMDSGMGSGVTAGMTWDLGMVALAVLMLISGIIMTDQSTNDSRM